MKRIILAVIFLSVCSLCSAEVYLVIDKNSKEIYTASEKNDTVLKANQELISLPGKFENYELAQAITDYKYTGNKFVLNQSKIDADNKAVEEENEIAAEEELINKRMRKLAIDALKAEGVELKHIDK